eukprot:403352190
MFGDIANSQHNYAHQQSTGNSHISNQNASISMFTQTTTASQAEVYSQQTPFSQQSMMGIGCTQNSDYYYQPEIIMSKLQTLKYSQPSLTASFGNLRSQDQNPGQIMQISFEMLQNSKPRRLLSIKCQNTGNSFQSDGVNAKECQDGTTFKSKMPQKTKLIRKYFRMKQLRTTEKAKFQPIVLAQNYSKEASLNYTNLNESNSLQQTKRSLFLNQVASIKSQKQTIQTFQETFLSNLEQKENLHISHLNQIASSSLNSQRQSKTKAICKQNKAKIPRSLQVMHSLAKRSYQTLTEGINLIVQDETQLLQPQQLPTDHFSSQNTQKISKSEHLKQQMQLKLQNEINQSLSQDDSIKTCNLVYCEQKEVLLRKFEEQYNKNKLQREMQYLMSEGNQQSNGDRIMPRLQSQIFNNQHLPSLTIQQTQELQQFDMTQRVIIGTPSDDEQSQDLSRSTSQVNHHSSSFSCIEDLNSQSMSNISSQTVIRPFAAFHNHTPESSSYDNLQNELQEEDDDYFDE